MIPTAPTLDMMQLISQPAFAVKDGSVIATNEAAQQLHIDIGMSVSELITQGIEEYNTFTAGKLFLHLRFGQACVSVCDKVHLFCIDDNYSASPELRAFALAAQHLREPLNNALSGVDQLFALDNAKLQPLLGKLNRNLFQIMRTVCNMSDVAQLDQRGNTHMSVQNVTACCQESFEKISATLEGSGKTLKFTNLPQPVSSLIDAQLIERMISNLISNAVKFSPADCTIKAKLKHNGNRLSLTVENPIQDGVSGTLFNAFSKYLRAPSVTSYQEGIGLGMALISRIAYLHHGTVLLESSRSGNARITVSIPIKTDSPAVLKSPITLLGGYTGGIDTLLVEFSDILPSSNYESI